MLDASGVRRVLFRVLIGGIRGNFRRDVFLDATADAVGVNYQTIGFLERGDYGPSLKLAFAIAEFFKLPIEAIFSTDPFTPLSEQVYGQTAAAGTHKQGAKEP